MHLIVKDNFRAIQSHLGYDIARTLNTQNVYKYGPYKVNFMEQKMLKRALVFVAPKNKWKQKTIKIEEVYSKASNERRIKK